MNMNKRDLLRQIGAVGATAALASVAACGGAASAAIPKTTFILVHGAFAGSEGWSDVTQILQAQGHTVIAAPNPLRGVHNDSVALGALIDSATAPVVLVGHSYGGFLISNAAVGRSKVKSLVYVGAFTPDAGESVVDLAGKYPGSTLGDTLAAVTLADGGKDLYIEQSKYHQQFCADITASRATILASNQRPITEAAIVEKSGAAAWKTLPSWHIYGTADKNIPAAAMKFMADRAHSKKTVELAGASHVPHLSQPAAVASIILEAAA